MLGRLFPARAGDPAGLRGATLAQRNAALRRVQLGLAPADALEPWTERVATLGAALVEQRRATLAALAPAFAERAGELGLPAARLGYDAEAADRRRARGAAGAATSSAARPGSARTSTTS